MNKQVKQVLEKLDTYGVSVCHCTLSCYLSCQPLLLRSCYFHLLERAKGEGVGPTTQSSTC